MRVFSVFFICVVVCVYRFIHFILSSDVSFVWAEARALLRSPAAAEQPGLRLSAYLHQQPLFDPFVLHSTRQKLSIFNFKLKATTLVLPTEGVRCRMLAQRIRKRPSTLTSSRKPSAAARCPPANFCIYLPNVFLRCLPCSLASRSLAITPFVASFLYASPFLLHHSMHNQTVPASSGCCQPTSVSNHLKTQAFPSKRCESPRQVPPYSEASNSSSRSKRYERDLASVYASGCWREVLHAVPLLTGITRSGSSKNADIPQFLLPPLFTAVEAADSHHAQSIVALWKKPGVPRVGVADDLNELIQERKWNATAEGHVQSFATTADSEKNKQPGTRTTLQAKQVENSTAKNSPLARASSSTTSVSSSSTTSNGLADQGDALLIMTGSSPAHLDTIGEAVVEALWEKHMRQVVGRDGRGFSGWVALSFMDLEVHIMTPITRERYALEELYSLCPRIDISNAIKIDKLEGFEIMSGGLEHTEPRGPPFDPEIDADYGFFPQE